MTYFLRLRTALDDDDHGMTAVRERPAAVLVAVSRPWFWPVSWVPAYLGTVLAGHSWLPARADAPRALVALLVLGPLVWGAVLAQNDLYDLPSDRANPRKATAPLVTGAITARRLRNWYAGLAAAALGCALYVGPLFVLGVGGVLLLGWAYSVPPLRLKTRPGWDVAVNAFVVGAVSPAAGWAITRAPWEFPWQFGLIGVLFAAALYVPTTVTDLAADTGAGDTTFAVRFGARTAYRIGVGLWAGALALCLGCAWLDVLVPRSTLVPQLITVPVLLVAYALLTRRPTIARMAVLSVFFAVPTVGFAMAYI
ncbi:UbiA prenyltransferase family protein [Actinoplanes aureus]|uniref:UbiA prenyltransferase family protein n=1 Tax=Actinoplanes aureus TaxID=2792083 RepID=A0A931C1D9_9ACTN|nr:UbiA prenyltransferase family protein [Actinoplanes aureus]MBG0561530.1 UbiA prenyltransferase family protein [Actinoplanes aureus]